MIDNERAQSEKQVKWKTNAKINQIKIETDNGDDFE